MRDVSEFDVSVLPIKPKRVVMVTTVLLLSMLAQSTTASVDGTFKVGVLKSYFS